MPIKILITGFFHSGTTLTMRLIQAHPQVARIFDEESYIEFDKPKEWMMKITSHRIPNIKKYAWGEKIPWGTRPSDVYANRVIEFSKKWLNYFGDDARIINVLRNPVDTVLSGAIHSDIKEEVKKALQFLLTAVPIYIQFINSDPRCSTVLYEELVTNSEETLEKICAFLKLKFDKKIYKTIIGTQLKFGKINASRAYANKDKSFYSSVEYEELIRSLKNRL
jgi:hypothetical protein